MIVVPPTIYSFQESRAVSTARISIEYPHVYLGELLEIVTKLTGVSLEIKDTDSISGEELLVSLKDITIEDFMDSIISIFSVGKAVWFWEKYTKNGKIAYRLERSVKAKKFPAFIEDLINTDFLNQIDSYNVKLNQNDIVDIGMSVFKNLNNDIKDRIIREDMVADFDIKSINKQDVSRLLGYLTTAKQITHKDYRVEEKDIEKIQLLKQVTVGSQNLSLKVKWTNDGASGYSLINASMSDDNIKKRILEEWKNDSDKDNVKGRIVKASSDKYSLNDLPKPIDRYMANTINRFSGSVIARLKVGKNPQNVQMYQGEELKEFLLFLDAKLGIQNKAHKNILLLNHISRFLDEDRLRPSWSTVRRLRKAVASDADSLLPASIFFRDCPRLSSGQLQRLSEDFRGLQWGAELQPFFTFAQNIKVENLTSLGLPFSIMNPAFECLLGQMEKFDINMAKTIKVKIADGSAKPIGFSVNNIQNQKVGTERKDRRISFFVYPENGKFLAGTGFFYTSSQAAITPPYCATPP